MLKLEFYKKFCVDNKFALVFKLLNDETVFETENIYIKL